MPGREIPREADLPTVLATADIERYRDVFALQEKRSWKQADQAIADLHDGLLLGHILAQRYLDLRYKPGYRQLLEWLHRYADEPEAKAIYALASALRPAHAPEPPKPVAAPAPSPEAGIDPQPSDVAAAASPAAPHAKKLAQRIRDLAARDPRQAELLLAGPEAKSTLDEVTRAQLRTIIAQAYLASGAAEQALVVSAEAVDAAYAPVAHWEAGLAAWRLGRLGEARTHFEALARSPDQSDWTRSAAAFWAARVAERLRRPDHAAYWLGVAAAQPRTFYGLIARRLLGVDAYLDFAAEPFTELDARLLLEAAGGRRALALLEVGQEEQAEAELRFLALSGRPALLRALAALADRANLPGLSLQLAGALANADGRTHDHALYPVPRWTPVGGFTVDRALLFALMRQESLFAPAVKSNAGALGLMQLMPETLRAMALRTGFALSERGAKAIEQDALADPELNLALAQKYVKTLLADPHIGGDLLLFAVAYNRGPGAALRWQAEQPGYRKDPLLFLESIPDDARSFAERVLTNYWIYRERLGQPSPDLDALAAGQWPTYTAFDSVAEGVRHAAYR